MGKIGSVSMYNNTVKLALIRHCVLSMRQIVSPRLKILSQLQQQYPSQLEQQYFQPLKITLPIIAVALLGGMVIQ